MALILRNHTGAIVWAHWRSFMNRSPLLRRFPLTGIVMAVWYGLWTLGAIAVAAFASAPESLPLLAAGLSGGLLVVTLYWQVIPILMASSGASLDLKRLIVYPVAHRELFGLEVLLRVTSAGEMLLITAGAAIGILLNPRTSAWGVLAFVPFVLFNLFLASGIRDLLSRLMAKKHVRELMILAIVVASALPQWFLNSEKAPHLGWASRYVIDFPWPWVAVADLALGRSLPFSGAVLLAWTFLAYWLARRQFEVSLRESPAEQNAQERATSRRGLAEVLYRIPSRIFGDPLAAMIEKDLRTLSRSPRFRLVFIMGFTFGLLVWLPIGFRREHPNWVGEHYLAVAMAYEVMLLGEVIVWNVFGFDRHAVQVYFAVPVKLTTVIAAKNLSAVFFVFLDAVLIILMCTLLGFSVTVPLLGEAFAVTIVLTILLVSIGNMLSFHNPRPVNPDQSWGRNSAGRVQAALLLVYPVVLAPIALAFLARAAFDTEWAFYGVMLFDLILACIVYWVALDSALKTAAERREQIIAALSRDAGVIAA